MILESDGRDRDGDREFTCWVGSVLPKEVTGKVMMRMLKREGRICILPLGSLVLGI